MYFLNNVFLGKTPELLALFDKCGNVQASMKPFDPCEVPVHQEFTVFSIRQNMSQGSDKDVASLIKDGKDLARVKCVEEGCVDGSMKVLLEQGQIRG